MNLPPDDDKLKQVLDEAGNFAARAGVPYCSAHLLLALLAADDAAANLLTDRGLDASRTVRHLGELGVDAESDDMLQQIRERARRMAQSCGSRAVRTRPPATGSRRGRTPSVRSVRNSNRPATTLSR